MIRQFEQYILERCALNGTEKILLAISGGVDSVVLLDLFKRSSFDFGIAHVNFHLRGKESDDDEKFVLQSGQAIKKETFLKSFDTLKISGEQGLGIQETARALRYDFFEEVRFQKGYDFIATAHHLNDSIETSLFNLSRGTGIAGLKGIVPVSGKVIRPLLFATKAEILQYAHEYHLQFREDSSNSQLKYSRNRIRQRVIPELEKLNPELVSNYEQTLQNLQEQNKIYQFGVRILLNQIVSEENGQLKIRIEQLLDSVSPSALLYEVLHPYGFDRKVIPSILSVLTKQAGKMFFSSDFQVLKDREFLILEKKSGSNKEIHLIEEDDSKIQLENFNLQLQKDEVQSIENMIDQNPSNAIFDFDKLKFPLQIRNWEPGDAFYPIGMKGKKKLSDLFSDLKVDRLTKKKLKVVLSDNDIIWIPGYRMDERYKVDSGTRTILRVKLTREAESAQ